LSTPGGNNAARVIFMFRRFAADERGASAIEYCMLALFLSIAIIAGARSIGTTLNNKIYGPVSTNLS
jgi:pilus assembly protein Flp/PilA